MWYKKIGNVDKTVLVHYSPWRASLRYGKSPHAASSGNPRVFHFCFFVEKTFLASYATSASISRGIPKIFFLFLTKRSFVFVLLIYNFRRDKAHLLTCRVKLVHIRKILKLYFIKSNLFSSYKTVLSFGLKNYNIKNKINILFR